MRIASVVMISSLGMAASVAQAQSRPAVVELFTSEGCSSCPPAEAFLGELAQRPDVLALAFHVDYWDGLGWRDRFVVSEATPRQRGYARTMRLSSIYTPQAVIDGTGDFVGSDRAKIARSLQQSRTGVPVGVSLQEGSIIIEVGAESHIRSSDVTLIAFARSAVSAIGRGENSGRTLTEYNIVRGLRHLGEYDGHAQIYRAEISALPKDATDVAVLIQASDQGAIVGAGRLAVR